MAVLKSDRQVIVPDQFIEHVSKKVTSYDRKTVCQALERFSGEHALNLWDDLAALFDQSIKVLSQIDDVSLICDLLRLGTLKVKYVSPRWLDKSLTWTMNE